MVTQTQLDELDDLVCKRARLTDEMTEANRLFQEAKKKYLVLMEEFLAKEKEFREESEAVNALRKEGATVPDDVWNKFVQRADAHSGESKKMDRQLGILSDEAGVAQLRVERLRSQIMDLTEQIAKIKEKTE